MIAWGAWQVFAFTRDEAFLREAYAHNARLLAWCRDNRRLTALELYNWNTTSDVNCRCDESGMDNSPASMCRGRWKPLTSPATWPTMCATWP